MSRDLTPRDGSWSETIAGVVGGNLYRFEFINGSATLQRLDPATRDAVSSELTCTEFSGRNASVVLASEPFSWTPFDTPRLEKFIIYELHVGASPGHGRNQRSRFGLRIHVSQ